MANTSISPNMSLPIPVVGTDPGPDWANNLNNCLTLLDAHTHNPGSGVQITPSGLNINTDLSIGNNNLTSVNSVQYLSLSSDPSTNNTSYVKSGDFYLTDGSGNHIRLTSGGSIVGATGNIGGLGGGAAVTYVNPTTKFVFIDNNTNPAALDSGALIIRETDATSPNAITLQSPTALAGNYSLTLFTSLPGSTQAVNITSGGNLSTISYDSIGSSMTSTGANAIANTRTRAFTTPASLGDVGISPICVSFNTTSNNPTFVDVTNLSLTITVSGLRPVYVGFIASGGVASNIVSDGTNNPNYVDIRILRGATVVGFWEFTSDGGSGFGLQIPPGSINLIEAPAAGTYTYKAQMACNGSVVGNTVGQVNQVRLVAYEL